jgi:hypothetical protein
MEVMGLEQCIRTLAQWDDADVVLEMLRYDIRRER